MSFYSTVHEYCTTVSWLDPTVDCPAEAQELIEARLQEAEAKLSATRTWLASGLGLGDLLVPQDSIL